MDILLALYPVVVIGGLLGLCVAMIVHAIKNRKWLWLVILVLFNILSGVLYYFVVYRTGSRSKKKGAIGPVLVWGLVGLMLASLIYAFLAPPTPSTEMRGLKEIPMSEVARLSNEAELSKIVVTGDTLVITRKNEGLPSLKAYKQPGSSIYSQGINVQRVDITIKIQ